MDNPKDGNIFDGTKINFNSAIIEVAIPKISTGHLCLGFLHLAICINYLIALQGDLKRVLSSA